MSTNNVKNHSPLKYRPDIDGMRAIAIILVVIYHAFPKFITGGFFGVDVFFVLSGYLISTIIIEQLNSNSFRLTDFYVRRIKRIVPALVTVMIASLILGWFLLLPVEYKQLGKHLLGGSTFISNFLSWNEVGYFDGAAESKPLLHLWSLSVEEQFYLLWPITLSWFYTKKYNLLNVIVLIALFSFILNIILVKFNTDAAFYFPVARFWELMIGAMIIFCGPKTKQPIEFIRNYWSLFSFLGLFIIIAVCCYVKKQFQIPGFWALLPTLGTALLIITENGWVNRKLLSSRFMVWLGKISYPLYLWHWPVLSFLHITHPEGVSRSLRILAIIISIGLAWLTYLLIERPIRFAKYYTKIHAPLFALLVILGGVGFTDYLGNGWAFRFPKEIMDYIDTKYDYGKQANITKCWLSDKQKADGFDSICYKKSGGSQRAILVWGDSHAGCLYPGLLNVFGPKFNIAQFTRDSCPPVLNYGYPRCRQSNDYVLSVIKKRNPETVVLFAVWNNYTEHYTATPLANQLNETIAELHKIGIQHIVVLGPVPQWQMDLPKVLYTYSRRNSKHTIPAMMKRQLKAEPFRFNDEMVSALASGPAEYFSVTHALCNEKGCRTRATDDPKSLMTWDYGHLSVIGAEYISKRLPLT